jgi:hypothetical protein
MEVVDARNLKRMTNSALVAKDGEAWTLLGAIRDFGAEAIWIPNSHGAEDVLVVFIEAIGETMHVRDQAVYEIDGNGNARRLVLIDTPKPKHELPADCSPSRIRSWTAHIFIAVVAALVAHPIVETAGELAGFQITLPAVVPALLGLGVGFAVARPLTRRVSAYRRVLARALELPDCNAEIVKRLDQLHRDQQRFRD